jgi:environmental stress-induced protein Ves
VNARLLRSAEIAPQPWNNGMGRTREIAVYPPGADSTQFLWRVSVAEVDSAAPFSSFPGIDRQIALLEGAGFIMTLDAAQVHRLDRRWVPFAFPGEAAVAVELIDGPTRDFNLMLRRGEAQGRIEVWRAGVAHRTDGVALLYCAHGEVAVPDGVLHAGDGWLAPPTGVDLLWRGEAVLLAVMVSLATEA